MFKTRYHFKVLTILLSICLLLNTLLPSFSAAQQTADYNRGTLFTMEQAVQYGIMNSYDLSSIKSDLVKKKLELLQAREGLKDIRKKESTIQFSLLFNIKFPQGHGMPREVDLVTKIPGINSDIQTLEKSLEFAKKQVETNVKIEYTNTVTALLNVENNQRMLDGETETLNMLKRRYKLGQASPEQISGKQKEVDQLSEALSKALLDFEDEKTNLSDLTGFDVTYGYTFEKKFIVTALQRQYLKGMMDYSREKSLDVYKANSKLKISENKVQLVREVYRRAFGSSVSSIEAELNKPGELDYDAFLSKYEASLEDIRKKWDGFFFVFLPLFIIPIPKEWIQPEYAGSRYFEDQKYVLPNVLLERDKVKKEAEQVIKKHDNNITNLYKSLKEMESAYYTLAEGYGKAQEDYNIALRRSKLGLIPFEQLEAMKKNLTEKSAALISILGDYNKGIYMYSLQTNGAVDKYIRKTPMVLDKMGTGLSFLQKKDADKDTPAADQEKSGGSGGTNKEDNTSQTGGAKWFVDSSNTDYKAYFRVSVPESLGATHYSLFTSTRRQIGSKTEIKKRIMHMPIMYEDAAELRVEFYKSDDLIATAALDGFDIEGDLKITTAKPAGQEKVKYSGTWLVTPDETGIMSSLTITVDPLLGATHYQLYSPEIKPVGAKTEISKSLSHLSVVLQSMSGMKIKLYKGDKPVAEASMIAGGILDINTLK